MPRGSKRRSIDDSVRSSIEPIVRELASALAGVIAGIAAERLEAELSSFTRTARIPARPSASRRPPAAPKLTRWVADRRARRVPSFVIELTGLDTKKKVVARYGHDALFEKGRPAPPARGHASRPSRQEVPTPRVVKARPPLIRKAAAAAQS